MDFFICCFPSKFKIRHRQHNIPLVKQISICDFLLFVTKLPSEMSEMCERFLPFLPIFFCFIRKHSEFFRRKAKRFSEFYFTAEFWIFYLKMRFRMAGERKKSRRHFYAQIPCFFPETSLFLLKNCILSAILCHNAPHLDGYVMKSSGDRKNNKRMVIVSHFLWNQNFGGALRAISRLASLAARVEYSRTLPSLLACKTRPCLTLHPPIILQKISLRRRESRLAARASHSTVAVDFPETTPSVIPGGLRRPHNCG